MGAQWIFCLLVVGFLGVEGHFDWYAAVQTIKNETSSRTGILSNRPAIFPGTKWCGKGDIAADDNDLGSHSETDKCCRAHDKCPDTIEGLGTKYGLKNTAPYTRLRCDCDEKFLNCLKKSKDDLKVSDVVGTLYFDALNTKCFKLEHNVTGCKQRSKLGTRCLKYEIDRSSPEMYQWFDVSTYNKK